MEFWVHLLRCAALHCSVLQLVDHPFIKPSAIHSHEVLEGYADEFLYLGCVKFVKQASSSGGGAGWGCGRAPS